MTTSRAFISVWNIAGSSNSLGTLFSSSRLGSEAMGLPLSGAGVPNRPFYEPSAAAVTESEPFESSFRTSSIRSSAERPRAASST